MKKPLSTPLEIIIKETYLEWEKIIETVRKYNFEESLYPGFSKISNLINSKSYNSIPNVVGTLLSTINDKLSQLDGKEKEILEDLSSELFSTQISLLNSNDEGKLCWQKCIPAIKDTCEFKEYDFDALSRLLKIDFVKTSKIYTKNDSNSLPYYDWMESKNKLSELIRHIKDKQWIRNVNEFKKIFTPISDANYKYCAPSENKVKLLILFSELKNNNLIVPKINKGHLHPLYRYGVDLDIKLFQKEPKRYIESIKRKKVEYDSVLAEVQKIIRLNIKS